VLIGTSGWQYADWREPFYQGVPQKRWFEHVMANFQTVELNVTFYRLPKREVFVGWHARSPDDAVITVKSSRYLTHIKRLRDPKPSVDMLMERVEPLGKKLGPILVQLPPDMRADAAALADTLAAFPTYVRLAVEPSHKSWWNDDVRGVLTDREAERITAAYDDSEDVFVYFNNDPLCAAIDNAWTFGREVRLLGRTATRVPDERPITPYSAT
jgi:uncharacterized protein YecE (DUF72 family)